MCWGCVSKPSSSSNDMICGWHLHGHRHSILEKQFNQIHTKSVQTLHTFYLMGSTHSSPSIQTTRLLLFSRQSCGRQNTKKNFDLDISLNKYPTKHKIQSTETILQLQNLPFIWKHTTCKYMSAHIKQTEADCLITQKVK